MNGISINLGRPNNLQIDIGSKPCCFELRACFGNQGSLKRLHYIVYTAFGYFFIVVQGFSPASFIWFVYIHGFLPYTYQKWIVFWKLLVTVIHKFL